MHGLKFSNRTLSLVIGTLATGYLVGAFRLPSAATSDIPINSATLPKALGFLLLALSVALYFQRSKEGDDKDGDPPDDDPICRQINLGRLADARLEVGLMLLSMCVYVALFEPLGFVLSTFLYLTIMTYYLGYRRHIVTITVAGCLAVGFRLGITDGLGVTLPAGLLGW